MNAESLLWIIRIIEALTILNVFRLIYLAWRDLKALRACLDRDNTLTPPMTEVTSVREAKE